MNWRLTAAAALLAAASSHAAAETIAITGATVHTMARAGTLVDATVVIVDGRVRAIGSGVSVPDGARIIAGERLVVTPGLFDAWGRMGIVEIGAVDGTNDSTAEDSAYGAALNVTDAVNPRSELIAVNRIEGVTRSVVAPTADGHLIGGQAIVINLGGAGDWLEKSPAALAVQLGERGASLSGGSRAAALLSLREALSDARDYSRNRSAYERGARRAYARSRLDLEALQPVLKGEVPIVALVHRAADIEALLRLKREFKVRVIVSGGAEAWLVADQLAAESVPVIMDPLVNLPGSFELLRATGENAARLHAAGVTVAFGTNDSHNARNLRQAAGNAVARGLPWDVALAAATVTGARVFGIDSALEEGKVADLVVWDGDPLELASFPVAVFINGAAIPLVSRQTELRDRYLRRPDALPHAYR
ncbi:MAG: amidohydrolase family protein [Gammaproteobacteria bacterium]